MKPCPSCLKMSPGHYVYNCPRYYCQYCNTRQPGHKEFNCPRKPLTFRRPRPPRGYQSNPGPDPMLPRHGYNSQPNYNGIMENTYYDYDTLEASNMIGEPTF